MIVTFYSFKGGVGRSFSLVESAVQLASRGASVAVWDLDLEAPGLQKIPFLARQLEPKFESGTLDLLWAFHKSDLKNLPTDGEIDQALVPFTLPDEARKAGGRLDFLLPGKLGSEYGKTFTRIDWQHLFAPGRKAGPAFFVHLSQRLRQGLGFEYVLVDARTGLTDLSAVSTLMLPDVVVIVFNFNEQNLAGIEQTTRLSPASVTSISTGNP